MRPRSRARLRLVRTILAIAAAYLFALQGIAAPLAASVHTAQRIDQGAAGPLCLADGDTGPSDAPLHSEHDGGCALHCAGQGFAGPIPRIARTAPPLPIEAAAPAVAEFRASTPRGSHGSFSARAPPIAA